VIAFCRLRITGATRTSLAAQYASNFETPTRVVSPTLLINYLVTPVESAAAAFVV